MHKGEGGGLHTREIRYHDQITSALKQDKLDIITDFSAFLPDSYT